MENTIGYLLLSFIVLMFLYIYFSPNNDEDFIIPQNIVAPGDFDYGIEPPGEIADQGSFTTDMQSYLNGQGQI